MFRKKNFDKSSKKRKNENQIIIILSSVAFILMAALSAYVLKPVNQNTRAETIITQTFNETIKEVSKLRYWGVSLKSRHENGPMRTMGRAFERLQFEFVNASNGDDWDIMWSIEHPNDASSSPSAENLFAGVNEGKLRREQKINHFNGIGALTLKSFMNSLNRDSPYILPFFFMPKDFEKLNNFLKTNPNVSIVEKNIYNRGVEIKKLADVSVKKSEYFYQQFLDDHFLIDGHAFDMGVYVLITSFEPLRVYRYNADVLFRFCPEKYHPFDPRDIDKYVVQGGAYYAHEMPTFEKIYEQYQFPLIKIFEKYIRELGHDVKKFWRKIDDAIVSIVRRAAGHVIKRMKQANYANENCFELVRFDFLFDSKLNPFVMEVNMSPNLTPAHRTNEESVKIYEPMVYNVIQMIGGGSYYEFVSRFENSDSVSTNGKHIATDVKACINHDCVRNCDNPKCSVCLPCVSEEDRYQMREAVREQKYVGNFVRLFPTKLHHNDKKLISEMTETNKISLEWFRARCESDIKWC